MKKTQKESFELLPIPELHPRNDQQNTQDVAKPQHGSTRMSVEIYFELMEKIKDFAYWQGLTQQQTTTQALEYWLKDKPIKTRPEAVKNRQKVGRKKKRH